MSKRQAIWTVVMLGAAFCRLDAQDSAPDSQPNSASQPAAAFGQENAPAPVSQNPPLSGIDLPSLVPEAAPLSYLQPSATMSESLDSNAANLPGQSSFHSITRGLGNLTLKRLWRNYDLAVDYSGGAGYYSLRGQGAKLLQEMALDQKIKWKRGQLSLRDNFSYLPEGNFGQAYGSSTGIGSLEGTSFAPFFGGNSLGTFGLAPRIVNVSLADLSENLTPKSAITAAAGYGFTHFYGSDVSTGTNFIGTSQLSVQLGYNRFLNSRTQMALVYGHQVFDFSVVGTALHSDVVELLYGHSLSGRMDLLIGAGPQIISIDSQAAVCSDPTVPLFFCQALGDTLSSVANKDHRLGVTVQSRLRYKFPKTSLTLKYIRLETGGSGLFAGAQSDIATLSANRPLSRVWSAFADIGYHRSARTQSLTQDQVQQCTTAINAGQITTCPANDATNYASGFLGGGLQRSLGRTLRSFFSYQFNEFAFDRSYCLQAGPCNRISNRSVITFGLDWTPRPIRID